MRAYWRAVTLRVTPATYLCAAVNDDVTATRRQAHPADSNNRLAIHTHALTGGERFGLPCFTIVCLALMFLTFSKLFARCATRKRVFVSIRSEFPCQSNLHIFPILSLFPRICPLIHFYAIFVHAIFTHAIFNYLVFYIIFSCFLFVLMFLENSSNLYRNYFQFCGRNYLRIFLHF